MKVPEPFRYWLWALRAKRHGYFHIIAYGPGPPATVERLRRRVLAGNWADALSEGDGVIPSSIRREMDLDRSSTSVEAASEGNDEGTSPSESVDSRKKPA